MFCQALETVVDRLPDLLPPNDTFGILLVSELRAALASAGLAPGSDSMVETDVLARPNVEERASKEVIRAMHQSLRRHLRSSLAAQNPITLAMPNSARFAA